MDRAGYALGSHPERVGLNIERRKRRVRIAKDTGHLAADCKRYRSLAANLPSIVAIEVRAKRRVGLRRRLNRGVGANLI